MKLLFGCAVIGAVGWLSVAGPARACECASQNLYSTFPADGAQGVARNTGLEISGFFEPGSIAVADVQGRAVAFTLSSGPAPSCPGSSAGLLLAEALRANTTYVVSVKGLSAEAGDPNTFRFTTGAELLPDEAPAPPTGAASLLFDVEPDGQSCGDGDILACVSMPVWEPAEILAKRGDETVLRWALQDHNEPFDGLFKLEQQPDCVELRRVTATGRRSAPTTICGDALKARAFETGDWGPGRVVACRGGVIGAQASNVAADGGAAARGDAGAAARGDAGAAARGGGGTARADTSSSSAQSSSAAPPASADAAEPRPSDTPTAAQSNDNGCSASPRNDRGAHVPLFVSIALLLAAATRRLRAARSSPSDPRSASTREWDGGPAARFAEYSPPDAPGSRQPQEHAQTPPLTPKGDPQAA